MSSLTLQVPRDLGNRKGYPYLIRSSFCIKLENLGLGFWKHFDIGAALLFLKV